MAALSVQTVKTLRAYVQTLQAEIPVQQAVVFGSYGRGTARQNSDIDIAIFSNAFRGRRRLDVIAYLLQKAAPFPLLIEPIGFPDREYQHPSDDFVRAIRREGKRII